MISVQNLSEALEATHAGAGFLDLKDPSAGPLGPVEASTARRVCRELPPSITLSMALGEWVDRARDPACLPEIPPGIDYVKIGFSGLVGSGGSSSSGRRLTRTRRSPSISLSSPDPLATLGDDFRRWRESVEATLGRPPRWIAVHYADASRVEAPDLDTLLDLARQHFDGVLVDTYHKDYGPDGLYQWLGVAEIERLREFTRREGLPLALAGSLSFRGLERAVREGGDVVGVRGLVTERGERISALDRERVREAIELVDEVSAGPLVGA